MIRKQQIDALADELDGLDARDLWEIIFDLRALLTEGAADMSTPARLAWKDRVREALK